ncbi:UNVERIFIED_CONTAM: HEAT repeat protein [Acetivibrio alkalicellulosi]
MSIYELEKNYEFAMEGQNLSEGERISRNMQFVKLLLSNNDQSTIDYHYSLLKKREYKDLYYYIRAAFKKRPQIEEFLVEKIANESDPIVAGDILHILGGIRSSHGISIARKFASNEQEYHREVALYVIGWMGDESDIMILNNCLLSEDTPHLRITAASAHRQISFRLPDLKNKLLLSLKKGYENEKSDEVISWIIIMIQSIAVKRMGLREDKEDPYIIHGELHKAKLKTEKFLSQLS